MKKAILICLLFPLLSKAQDVKQHYKIFNTHTSQVTNLSEIVKDMKDADVIFFGEEHNDSIGHFLEYTILKNLAETFQNRIILTMEMFHTDVQPMIDEYLTGVITEKNFIKEARAWNNYKDYRPMIELAKDLQLHVIGANGAARYSNAVTRNGLEYLAKFPKNSKKFIPPLPIDTLTGRYYDKFTALLGGHSMGGMKVYQSQNFWDATMAWSIAQTAKKYKKFKIFQVNGRFHSDEQLGTYAQLKKYAPKLKLINISSFSAEDFEQPNWDKYKNLGDYVIVTDPKVKKTF